MIYARIDTTVIRVLSLTLNCTGDVGRLSLHRDTISPPRRYLDSSSSKIRSFSSLERISSRRRAKFSLSFSSSLSSTVMPSIIRFSSKSASSSLRFCAAFFIWGRHGAVRCATCLFLYKGKGLARWREYLHSTNVTRVRYHGIHALVIFGSFSKRRFWATDSDRKWAGFQTTSFISLSIFHW